MKKIINAIFIFIFCNSLTFAALSAQMQDYTHSFLFPIDVSQQEGKRTNLRITVNQEFRCIQEHKLLNDPNYHGILEFIPKNEDEYKWSKIITLNSYVGKSIKAQDLMTFMKNNFLQNAVDAKILEENVFEANSVETAVISIVYNNKERRELVRIKVFSGPADCASIQYAIVLDKGKGENQELKKIKSWLDHNNVELINF